MLTAALLLVGYNLYDDHQAEVATSHVLEALQHEMPTPVLQEPEPSEPPDYVINPDMEMPTIEIENNDYIGVLEIPSLELTLPVMSEWSYAGLKIAPCRYSGSVYTGSMAIVL